VVEPDMEQGNANKFQGHGREMMGVRTIGKLQDGVADSPARPQIRSRLRERLPIANGRERGMEQKRHLPGGRSFLGNRPSALACVAICQPRSPETELASGRAPLNWIRTFVAG
jgi:hypothetical protein